LLFSAILRMENNLETMKKQIALLLLLITLSWVALAQTNMAWKGKKCAVVLTYDDGLNVHQTNALPALDSLGLKASFYISDYFGGLQAQIPKWRSAAAKGHELGNHTLHHPCDGSLPGRDFVKAEYDLSKYTVQRMTDEIRSMNTLLNAIDGKTKRTFAYPCGDLKVKDTAYIDRMKNEFVAARGVHMAIPTAEKVDLYNVNCYVVNGQTGEELIEQVKGAEAKGGLLVFLFHGVGGEHGLNVSLEAHRQLLHYLKVREKHIWIAPMLEVAEFIKSQQKKQP
jgi:peptidoglycan-N-acetylglucosamine deacetylase